MAVGSHRSARARARRRIVTPALATLVALVTAACGDDDSASGTLAAVELDSSATTTSTPSTDVATDMTDDTAETTRAVTTTTTDVDADTATDTDTPTGTATTVTDTSTTVPDASTTPPTSRPPSTPPPTPPTTTRRTPPTTSPPAPPSTSRPPRPSTSAPPGPSTSPTTTIDDNNSRPSASAPCISCLGVPPSGVAEQIGYFGGGASPPHCDDLYEEGTLYAGIKFRPEVALGTNRYFCLMPQDAGQPVSIEIAFPDGSTVAFEWVADGGDDWLLDPQALQGETVRSALGQVIWTIHSELPLGTFRLTAAQTINGTDTVEASSEFTVAASDRPRVQTSPPQRFDGELIGDTVYQPGDTIRFMLSGFEPNSSVTPLVYAGANDASCPGGLCFTAALPSVTTNALGVAEVELATDEHETTGFYCLTTGLDRSCEHFDSGGDAGFGGEFFLGEPTL